jgi:hypothetical protein
MLSRIPYVCFCLLLLLCLGCWAAEDAKLSARAEKLAAELEPSADRFVKNAVSFASEVANFLAMPEERKSALMNAAETYGKLRFKVRRDSFQGYFMRYPEKMDGSVRWDAWADWQLSAENLATWDKVAAEWAALLQSKLSPEEWGRWQKESEMRIAKGKALWRKQAELRYKQWRGSLRTRLSERLSKDSEVFQLSAQRLKSMSAALDAACEAYDAVALSWWAKQSPDWEHNCYFHRASYLRDLEAKGVGNFSQNSAAVKAADEAFEKKFKTLLTKQELAAVEKRKQQLDKRVEELLAAMQEHGLAGVERNRATIAGDWLQEVQSALQLSDDRREKLRLALEEENKRINAEWRRLYKEDNEQRVRDVVQEGDESQMLKMEQGRMWYGSSKASNYAKKAEGQSYRRVEQERLTVEEREKLESVMKQTREVVRAGLVAMLVTELDAKLNLLPEQRAKLEQLCMKHAGALEKLPGAWSSLGEWADSSQLLPMMYPLPEKQVAEILDKKQMESFKGFRESQEYQWKEIAERMEGL